MTKDDPIITIAGQATKCGAIRADGNPCPEEPIFASPYCAVHTVDAMRLAEKERDDAIAIAEGVRRFHGGEFCAEARAAGRNACGACAWCVKEAQRERDDARAALAARKPTTTTKATIDHLRVLLHAGDHIMEPKHLTEVIAALPGLLDDADVAGALPEDDVRRRMQAAETRAAQFEATNKQLSAVVKHQGQRLVDEAKAQAKLLDEIDELKKPKAPSADIDDGGVRPFGPLEADHPIVTSGAICPLCNEQLVVGERPCLLPHVMVDNNIAEAKPAHWTCHVANKRLLKAVLPSMKAQDDKRFAMVRDIVYVSTTLDAALSRLVRTFGGPPTGYLDKDEPSFVAVGDYIARFDPVFAAWWNSRPATLNVEPPTATSTPATRPDDAKLNAMLDEAATTGATISFGDVEAVKIAPADVVRTDDGRVKLTPEASARVRAAAQRNMQVQETTHEEVAAMLGVSPEHLTAAVSKAMAAPPGSVTIINTTESPVDKDKVN